MSETIPYSEPYWYSEQYKSPYYTEAHKRFAKKVRDFVDKELAPFSGQWDEAGEYPRELHQKAYAAGILGANWPVEFGGTPPEGGKFDAFHDLIFHDELARCGAGGVLTGLFFTLGIALPPILRFGSDFLKQKYARRAITGETIMALAVTEPYAGSDVAALQTTARREGNFYIVNGEKKFISSGTRADYMTVAVRTGGEGHGGISMLVIERNTPGLTTRRMKTQGWWASSTAYVTFEDVKVPVENLIGKENEGFKYIMYNFNHERFIGVACCNRSSRICVEDAISYARKRKTFGKRLADHPVIRTKIAEMVRHVETTHALLETIAYQMSQGVPDSLLGGMIGLAKVQATRTLEFCAREASQILGGASCIRGGQGERIERIYREVRINAIGGGSEEVLLDLVARQARL